MRFSVWLGRMLLLGLLALFVVPGAAEADRGRHRGWDRHRDRGRIVVRGDFGHRRFVHNHYSDCGHRWVRDDWRYRDRVYYPRNHRHYPRRSSVGVVIHIPF